jgi:hypothetical protein
MRISFCVVAHSAESIFFQAGKDFKHGWYRPREEHYRNVNFLPYCPLKGCGKLFNEFAVILRCGP